MHIKEGDETGKTMMRKCLEPDIDKFGVDLEIVNVPIQENQTPSLSDIKQFTFDSYSKSPTSSIAKLHLQQIDSSAFLNAPNLMSPGSKPLQKHFRGKMLKSPSELSSNNK